MPNRAEADPSAALKTTFVRVFFCVFFVREVAQKSHTTLSLIRSLHPCKPAPEYIFNGHILKDARICRTHPAHPPTHSLYTPELLRLLHEFKREIVTILDTPTWASSADEEMMADGVDLAVFAPCRNLAFATDDDVFREFGEASLPNGRQALDMFNQEETNQAGLLNVMGGKIKLEEPDNASFQLSSRGAVSFGILDDELLCPAEPFRPSGTTFDEGGLPCGLYDDDQYTGATVSDAPGRGASAAPAVEPPESPTISTSLSGHGVTLNASAARASSSAVTEDVHNPPRSDHPLLMLTDGKTRTDPKTACLFEPRTGGPKSLTLAINRTAHRDSQLVRVQLPRGSGPQVQRWELSFVSLKGTKSRTATKGWKKTMEIDFLSEEVATSSFDIEGLLRPFQQKKTTSRKKAKATPNQWREDGHFVLRRIVPSKGGSCRGCFQMAAQLFARSGLRKRLTREEKKCGDGWTPPLWGHFSDGLPSK